MARSWLIDSRGIANKVKNASLPSACQIKDSGANRECPNCKYLIDNSDVSQEWPGLPAGVKFEPTDADLVEHLAAKCGVGNSKPHLFLDEFIPTLEWDKGICYTHPENLPGAKKDGSSIHFFHRTVNAYATGQRKRRKIYSEDGLTTDRVRWHKTGKTKPVISNGTQRGCKKILVLYTSSKKGFKSDKANWVMHQYHLGVEEDEQDGDFVVSKIFYQQPKQTEPKDDSLIVEDSDIMTLRTSPMTPIIPNPPRRGETALYEDAYEDSDIHTSAKEGEAYAEAHSGPFPPIVHLDSNEKCTEWLAGISQAADIPDPDGMEDNLLCKELFNCGAPDSDLAQNSNFFTGITRDAIGSSNIPCGIEDLANLDFDTPPDFQLADLQFLSQDSVFDWIDHI